MLASSIDKKDEHLSSSFRIYSLIVRVLGATMIDIAQQIIAIEQGSYLPKNQIERLTDLSLSHNSKETELVSPLHHVRS